MSAQQRLAQLDAKLNDAADRVRVERDRLRGFETRKRAVDAIAPLQEMADAVTFRKRDYSAEQHRALTLQLLARISNDENLVLDVASAGTPSGLIRVLDQSVERELEAAQRAHNEAKFRRDTFAREHADEIEAEKRDAEMRRIRDAFDGDDPTALREALEAAA